MKDATVIKWQYRDPNWWHHLKCGAICAFCVRALIFACLLTSASSGKAQDTANVFARQHILQIAGELQAELRDHPALATKGIAERRLDNSSRVAVRNRSGQGELHVNADDIFFVISGAATLVTGGAIVNPKGDVEVRGDSVRGGNSAQLRPGDVVHIPHSTPHQVLVKAGNNVVYIVVKVPRVPSRAGETTVGRE